MTQHDLDKHLDRIESAIITLEKERSEIYKEYIKDLPYKVGDKVLVTKWGGFQVTCYVGKITPSYRGIDVKFMKPRKDGTMSGQSAGIYSFEKVEVIKSAKGL